MEKLWIFVVFGIVIAVNMARKLAEYNRKRPDADDGWKDGWLEDDASPQTTTPQKPAGGPTQPAASSRGAGRATQQPSERVRNILQQLQQMESGQNPVRRTVPRAPAAAPPPPPPVPMPVVAAVPPASKRLVVAARPTTPVPIQKEFSSLPSSPRPALAAADSAPLLSKTNTNLAVSFPAARRALRQTRGGRRRPIVINLKGRGNLRSGIVLSEVLGQPRAFDI